MEILNLLDQIDGRLTRLTIGYPAALPEIWKVQKHVRYALNNPQAVDLEKYIEKARGRMTALAVNYPDFAEHLLPILQIINKGRT
jgi:hypothetical protein